MGVTVISANESEVILKAPLARNTNHKLTAFGGSIHSLAVLSCWALITETVIQAGFEPEYIVIQNGEMGYESPVNGDFIARSSWDSNTSKEKFFETLRRKRLARATLHSQIEVDGIVCARLTARFVADVKN